MAPALAAAFFFFGVAAATSVDINPVRIDLSGQGQPAKLRLTNTGNEPLSVQVDVPEWDQGADGADRLSETGDLLAVPPSFSIAPGEHQIVRIGYLGEPSAAVERSFRLLVTELPEPTTDDEQSSELAMRMRFGIPAFVAPQATIARPEIVLEDVARVDGATLITIANAGAGHVRLSGVESLGRAGWQPLPESVTVRYLLPGALATVRIPPESGVPSAIRISSIDGRDWEYVVRTPL